MNRSITIRAVLSLTLVFAMLSPTAAFAMGDGKKHFKNGMRHETAEEWDRAAENFALAVAENPKNPEYRLHLARSLFNASQMYMKKGTLAANEKDYETGYIAFRKAYAFDPTNELAKSEMARMVRLQEDKNALESGGTPRSVGSGIQLVPTAYGSAAKPAVPIPQRLEKYRDVPFPGGVDLQFIIKELARELELNVLFEVASFRIPRKTFIDLKNVTAARALDYIFLQEGLFFQKVGPQTILVASSQERTKFQQLVLRTFYLANASPKDIAKVVQTAIPAQPGRSQTIVLTDDATNSVTIRDTEENIRLIGQLIRSLDKDRAEVVMEVAIYEVNKNDLLQFGNQVGTGGDRGSLLNLGGAGLGIARAGDSVPITQSLPFRGLQAAGIAFGLPISSIIALQSKGNTKLLASTQIHAFNNEDSSARIGQRVPVQTAQIVSGGGTGTPGGGNNGFVSNVVNYEQVGLTLKFKPLVFPNQDVQVAMEIESKDVAAGGTFSNPIFTERTIKGTARIQNNKTLLLASVAQNSESNSRTGLPLLGLIPILGRLFTAPRKDNSQIDIVIAVTPRVIRAPAILPEDEIERPTGSVAVPTSNSLEAMVIEDEQAELLAAARRTPTNVEVQLPDQPAAPTYVRTSATVAPTGLNSPASVNQPSTTTAIVPTRLPEPRLVPIDASVKTLQLRETSDTVGPETKPYVPVASGPAVEVRMNAATSSLRAGEKTRIAVQIAGYGQFALATLGLKFDDKKYAVRSISLGDAFGEAANRTVTPFLNQNGKAYFSLAADAGKAVAANGIIAYVEIEALVDGPAAIEFDQDILSFLSVDGKPLVVRVPR